MKSAIVALAIFGCAFAASLDQDAKVLRSDFEQTPEGNFQSAYETENGISGQAVGTYKSFEKEVGAVVVQGSNAYTAPNGERIDLTYTADENGFHPQGAHLPTTPAPEPIPDYILRSLEYIKAHPYVEKKQF